MSVTFLEYWGHKPYLPSNCIFPRRRDCLKIRYSGSAIIICSSFSTLGAAPSGHGDLFGFILDSFFATSPGVNFMSINSLSVRLVNVSGMLFLSSLVNTEEKKLFNTSAFCLSVVVRLPSSLVKCAMPVLVLSLDCAYL